MTTGLIIGKFMPPHKGHELLIDFSYKLCDRLIVLVCGQETDEIPLKIRYNWLHNHYAYENILFIDVVDDIPMGEIDENGTAIEQKFWDAWVSKINSIEGCKNIDRVFSSDLYGERLAKELNALWIPVDPERITIETSATEIRFNPYKSFNLLIEEARDYYRKKVVIVGPESGGKTTLAKNLAKKFKTNWVPEYGRILSELKNNNLTDFDFYDIADRQAILIDAVSKNSNGITFVDTEAFTTYLYGKVYLDKELHYIKRRAEKQDFDLYLLLAPTVDWVDDNSRVQPDSKDRWDFYNKMQQFLEDNNKNYCVIDKFYFTDRFLQANDAVCNLLYL